MSTIAAQITSTSHPRFADSTDLLSDGAALRARGEQDGYLFFKHLLPADAILKAREDMLQIVAALGWLQSDTALDEGRIDCHALNQVSESEMRLDIGVTHAAYDEVQKLESFHRLPHHPNLKALYRTLFDQEVLVHPRHIARMITPHSAMTSTPPHQDYPHIQGTVNTWTCWFPLGDCSRDLGSLAILRGSHHTGYIPIEPARGAGNIAVQLCPWEQDWVEGDFEAGDVLTFPSFTVHKALPCQFPDRIRLSLDVRYQPLDEPVESRSLLPHCNLSWEQIYADWQQDDLKYYWRTLPLTPASWDPSFQQPARRIC